MGSKDLLTEVKATIKGYFSPVQLRLFSMIQTIVDESPDGTYGEDGPYNGMSSEDVEVIAVLSRGFAECVDDDIDMDELLHFAAAWHCSDGIEWETGELEDLVFKMDELELGNKLIASVAAANGPVPL